MKRSLLVPVVLGCAAIAAGCGSPREPATAPAFVLAGPIQPPPIYALIGHRETLQLSSQQIAALDSIGQAVHTENDPLIRRLRELRGDFRGRAPGADAMPPSEEVRSLAERIRENNTSAVAGVQEVLNEQQQARTCELFNDNGRARRGAARRQTDARRPPAQGQRAGQAEAVRAPATWAWCAPADEQPDTIVGPPQDTTT